MTFSNAPAGAPAWGGVPRWQSPSSRFSAPSWRRPPHFPPDGGPARLVGPQPQPFPANGGEVDVSSTRPARAVPRRLPWYGANPLNAFTRFFSKYAVFSGRASKSEYWWMQFWSLIARWFLEPLSLVVAVNICLIPIMGGMFEATEEAVGSALRGCLFVALSATILGALAQLALLVPSLALRVRRLHDSNNSGWWAAFWIAPAAAVEIIGYLADVCVFITGFTISDHFPQFADWITSSPGDLRGFENFLPLAPTVLYTALACALLILVMMRLTQFVFDLVVGFLSTNRLGARFDAPTALTRTRGGIKKAAERTVR